MATDAKQQNPVDLPTADRDAKGRLLPGTTVGKETRWPKGVSGFTQGAHSAGASVLQLLNNFDYRNMTEAEVRRIARDKKRPLRERAAAQWWLDILSDNPRTRRENRDRLMDRTVGKPRQTIEIDGTMSMIQDPNASARQLLDSIRLGLDRN